MTKQIINTPDAPGAIGPYAQGTIVNGLVYTSGQLGVDAQTKQMPESVEEQAHLVFKNLKAVLEAGGSDLNSVVKTLVFLADMNDFVKVNEIYASYFEAPYPARSAVQVAKLPMNAKVEIEAIAIVK
ncbi:MAG: RidA family protein [Bacilli bacterium]